MTTAAAMKAAQYDLNPNSPTFFYEPEPAKNLAIVNDSPLEISLTLARLLHETVFKLLDEQHVVWPVFLYGLVDPKDEESYFAAMYVNLKDPEHGNQPNTPVAVVLDNAKLALLNPEILKAVQGKSLQPSRAHIYANAQIVPGLAKTMSAFVSPPIVGDWVNTYQ